MRFLLAALSIVAFSCSTVSARPLFNELADYSYEQWVSEFGEVAPSHAPHIFASNLATIRAHNAKKHVSYKMGVNKFTGMTKDEFKEYIGRGYRSELSTHNPSSPLHPSRPHSRHSHKTAVQRFRQEADLSTHVPVSALPTSLDWRTKNVTTAVKDQGMCGGCWSFSTSETVESHVAIETGTLLTLSEQEILACTQNPQHCGGTGGCEGATQELGFALVAQKGLTTEKDWPYIGQDSTCDFGSKPIVAGITGYVALPANNYTALLNAGSQMPIAISAAAGEWQFYESGVLSKCDADVDHAIQLVGWGTDKKAGDYWLVRNSWGKAWGEAGYIRIKRYGEGKEPCQNDSTPGDGDGCSGGPSSISVCGLCGILSDSSYPTGGHLV